MTFLTYVVLPLEILTFFCAFLSDAMKFSPAIRKCVFFLLSALWVIATVSRPWGVSPDDWNYSFHLVLSDPFSKSGFEDAMGHSFLYYQALAIVRDFTDTEAAFLIIAGAALGLKLWLIGRITSHSLMSLFAYVSIFWMLHDVVQLRAAVASLLLILAIHLYSSGKKAPALASMAAAPMVHIQGAVVPIGIGLRWLFAERFFLAIGVVLFTQALVSAGVAPSKAIFAFIPIDSERALATLDASEGGSGLRLTTLVMVAGLALAIPGLRSWRSAAMDLAFYTVIGGFLVYWLTAGVGGVSNRLMQFLWVPIVLLAPYYKKNFFTYFGFILICLAYFYLSGWINQLMGHAG